MSIGFVKLHRKICTWEWYQDANTFRLFIHLLLNANHKSLKWQGNEVGRGQLITGLNSLNSQLGLSVQQIRTSLFKLKSTSEITVKTTNKFSIITLINYDSYQSREDVAAGKATSQITNEQQTDNNQSTTNKNVNNEKNVKNKDKRFAKPSRDDLEKYKREKGLNIDPQAFLNHYDSNGWKVGKNPMKDWQATARNWATRQSGFGNNQQPQQKQYSDFPS